MPRVREAISDDTEAIVSVTEDGWRTGHRDIVPREYLERLPVDRWRHEVSVGLRRPVADAFTYVAEIDGEFAGYCYVAAPSREPELGPGTAEVVALYVAPERWSRGSGGALMTAAIERLRGLGYADAVLWTFAANERAIAFYERHGWQPDGAEKPHPASGMPTVRLRRTL